MTTGTQRPLPPRHRPVPLLQLVPEGADGLVHRLEKKSQVSVVQSLLSLQSLLASQNR